MARDGNGKEVVGANSVLKALDVLEAIAQSTTPPAVPDLADRLALPRPTVYRIVAALASRGLVRPDADGRSLRLGFHLFELAHRAWSDVDLRGSAREALDLLHERSHEMVVLGIRSGHRFVYVDVRESRFDVRLTATVGQSEPLSASALGVAILSGLADDDDERELHEEIAAVAGWAAPSARRDAFRAAMRLAAGRGYAIRVSDGADGIASVAAPVLDFAGRPIAAIGVLGPAHRLTEDRLHALAPDVIEGARRTTSNAGNAVQSIEPRAQPAAKPHRSVREAFATATLLGKSPRWLPRRATLFLADILGPRILSAPTPGAPLRTVLAVDLGVLAGFTDDDALVVADRHRLLRVHAEGEDVRALAAFPDSFRHLRLNDAAIDPRGDAWLSVIDLHARPGRAAVFRVAGGTVAPVLAPLDLPSGMAWSPDGSSVYVVESARREVLRATFDRRSGEVGPFAPLVRLDPSLGTPDGLAVDADGALWIALWDGWRVMQFDADGRALREIVLPVPRPTGLAFGGSDLATLYITTARVRLSPRVLAAAPLSGSVLQMKCDRPGVPLARLAGNVAKRNRR